MNDRAIGLLENYDIEVKNTGKGRGAIWCDTNKGILVLKEYKGDVNKLPLIDKIQNIINDSIETDQLVKSKENELYVKDTDATVYILKQQKEGHECNYKNEDEVLAAFQEMALVHTRMTVPRDEDLSKLPYHSYIEEMQRHTNECKHVKNYLRKLKKKTEFEKALYKEYDYFYDKAVEVTERASFLNQDNLKNEVEDKGYFYHGDYQYHNILVGNDRMSIINFERLGKGSGVRDLYLLFRKIAEKSSWSSFLCDKMIDSYIEKRELLCSERDELILRLEYPEKFWKIVNYYYNSKKSWIPDRNQEKLDILITQEKAKERCIKNLKLT